jgi:hypothetical protein
LALPGRALFTFVLRIFVGLLLLRRGRAHDLGSAALRKVSPFLSLNDQELTSGCSQPQRYPSALAQRGWQFPTSPEQNLVYSPSDGVFHGRDYLSSMEGRTCQIMASSSAFRATGNEP